MKISKQANGNVRITLSNDELMDMIEDKTFQLYEQIKETPVAQKVDTRSGYIEIIIGDKRE